LLDDPRLGLCHGALALVAVHHGVAQVAQPTQLVAVLAHLGNLAAGEVDELAVANSYVVLAGDLPKPVLDSVKCTEEALRKGHGCLRLVRRLHQLAGRRPVIPLATRHFYCDPLSPSSRPEIRPAHPSPIRGEGDSWVLSERVPSPRCGRGVGLRRCNRLKVGERGDGETAQTDS